MGRSDTAGLVPDGCPLSPHEYRVLRLTAAGLTNSEISKQVGVASSTVRTQLHSAGQKLHVVNRTQAAVLFIRNGWDGWKPPQLTERAPRHPDPILSPFMQAYLAELDQWLASGMRDKQARHAMTVALYGARLHEPKEHA